MRVRNRTVNVSECEKSIGQSGPGEIVTANKQLTAMTTAFCVPRSASAWEDVCVCVFLVASNVTTANAHNSCWQMISRMVPPCCHWHCHIAWQSRSPTLSGCIACFMCVWVSYDYMTTAAAIAIRLMVFYWHCSLYFRCCVCVSFCCLYVYICNVVFPTFVLRCFLSRDTLCLCVCYCRWSRSWHWWWLLGVNRIENAKKSMMRAKVNCPE